MSFGFYKILQISLPTWICGLWFFKAPQGISEIQALASQAPWSCGFLAWTGWHCPFCGMTRALMAFLLGDLSSSFYFHPLGPAVGLLVFYFWFKIAFLPSDFKILKMPQRSLWSGGLLLFISWTMAKNILDL